MKLIIDNNSVSEYEKLYFEKHPKAKNKPIDNPYHPTINTWMVMKRPMMNALKQRWKDFIIWFINKQGYTDLSIEQCELKFTTYYKSNHRHDVDNGCPKFILDGLVESGFIIDDDYNHVQLITLKCDIDKDNPRTEIEVDIKKIKEDKE